MVHRRCKRCDAVQKTDTKYQFKCVHCGYINIFAPLKRKAPKKWIKGDLDELFRKPA